MTTNVSLLFLHNIYISRVTQRTYDHHSKVIFLFVGLRSGNVGGSFLRLTGGVDGAHGKEPSDKKVEVNTICMDDLVPLIKHKKVFIKMDIEKSEANAIRCAGKFFDQVDVRGILMEWEGKSGEDMDFITGFMSQHGLQPSKSGIQYIPENMTVKKGGNIYFLKTMN